LRRELRAKQRAAKANKENKVPDHSTNSGESAKKRRKRIVEVEVTESESEEMYLDGDDELGMVFYI